MYELPTDLLFLFFLKMSPTLTQVMRMVTSQRKCMSFLRYFCCIGERFPLISRSRLEQISLITKRNYFIILNNTNQIPLSVFDSCMQI